MSTEPATAELQPPQRRHDDDHRRVSTAARRRAAEIKADARDEALRCPACRGEAYLCERPHHGTATWAFHCRSFPHHNHFGSSGDGGPPSEWDGFYGARYDDA